MSLLLKLLIFPVFWIAGFCYGNAPEVSASDIVGNSKRCEAVRKKLGVSCIATNTNMSDLGQLADKINGSQFQHQVRAQILQTFSAEFSQNLKIAEHLTGQPIDRQDIDKLMVQAKSSCGSDLVLNPISKNGSHPKDPDDKFLKKNIVAMMELDRISLLLRDARVSDPKVKSQLQLRRNKIAMLYPLAQDAAHLGLRRGLEAEYRISAPMGDPGASSETLVDDYLFPDKDGKFKAITTSSGSYQGQLISRLEKSTQLSPQILREVRSSFDKIFRQNLKSIASLCQADSCTTLGVSLGLAAKTINDQPASTQSNYLAEVCRCNLRSPNEVFDPALSRGLTVATIGTFALCIPLTPVAVCPVMVGILGAVGTAVSGVDTYFSWNDARRSEKVAEISRDLPQGLRKENSENQEFAHDSVKSALVASDMLATNFSKGNLESLLTPFKKLSKEKQIIALSSELSARSDQLKNLPPDRMRQVAIDIIEKGQAKVSDVKNIGSHKLTENVNSEGTLRYVIERPTNSGALKGEKVIDTLMVDAKTGAIDANTPEARNLVRTMIEDSKGEVSVVSIDINFLGKVNYFRDGTLAGDEYLTAVAKEIHRTITHNEDFLFKTGGDELLIVLNTKDPQAVKAISEKIVNAIHNSKEAKAIFSNQARALAQDYRGVDNAKAMNDLPEDFVRRMTDVQKELANRDFSKFREDTMKSLKGSLQNLSKIQPSISIGGAVVKPGQSYEEVKQLADQQASQVKVEYKKELGLDTSKYGGASGSSGNSRTKSSGRAKPVVLDPL